MNIRTTLLSIGLVATMAMMPLRAEELMVAEVIPAIQTPEITLDQEAPSSNDHLLTRQDKIIRFLQANKKAILAAMAAVGGVVATVSFGAGTIVVVKKIAGAFGSSSSSNGVTLEEDPVPLVVTEEHDAAPATKKQNTQSSQGAPVVPLVVGEEHNDGLKPENDESEDQRSDSDGESTDGDTQQSAPVVVEPVQVPIVEVTTPQGPPPAPAPMPENFASKARQQNAPVQGAQAPAATKKPVVPKPEVAADLSDAAAVVNQVNPNLQRLMQQNQKLGQSIFAPDQQTKDAQAAEKERADEQKAEEQRVENERQAKLGNYLVAGLAAHKNANTSHEAEEDDDQNILVQNLNSSFLAPVHTQQAVPTPRPDIFEEADLVGSAVLAPNPDEQKNDVQDALSHVANAMTQSQNIKYFGSNDLTQSAEWE